MGGGRLVSRTRPVHGHSIGDPKLSNQPTGGYAGSLEAIPEASWGYINKIDIGEGILESIPSSSLQEISRNRELGGLPN